MGPAAGPVPVSARRWDRATDRVPGPVGRDERVGRRSVASMIPQPGCGGGPITAGACMS